MVALPVDFFALNPGSYSIAIWLFVKLLGLIYLFAYIPLLFQIQGLLGKDGIRPAAVYLNFIKQRIRRKRLLQFPTIFWLNSSDQALFILLSLGILASCLLILGIYPAPMLLMLYLIHLSLVTIGQEFLSFGWETLLMEITMGAFLLIALEPLNPIAWIALNLLLFRFTLQAGVSKLQSCDVNWRNCTALWYHYLTQPLPNTLAWYAYKLPLWFHRFSTRLMFFIEIIMPFGIFAPAEARLIVFIAFTGLQFFIWATGNFSFLNHLTVIFCLILLNNRFLDGIFQMPDVTIASTLVWQILIYFLSVLFLILQIAALVYNFTSWAPIKKLIGYAASYHLAYPHGIFAIMTTVRYEIVVEGSADGKDWLEYEFYYKPGPLNKRPRRISPYQPRLDWQAWFLPFNHYEEQHWFQSFLIRLLQGSVPVLKLLKHNPFPDQPPKYVRALIYDYQYTSSQERKQNGNWWKRTFIGEYAAAIMLAPDYLITWK